MDASSVGCIQCRHRVDGSVEATMANASPCLAAIEARDPIDTHYANGACSSLHAVTVNIANVRS